ncbi:ras-related protein Rap-1-like isoform X1 [Biomphalaria pfeifferi]|uniref:small monomeric GTPase n=1 Tax=Biomphalaria pfeifferi TaxID=112525 RepID=A0AAD8C8H8_BIOPF|nr:ras-related protein Rap-1-like isoform X1 [Biomphalaria pfeifferi]
MTLWCGSARERLHSEGDSSVYEEEYKIVVLGSKDVGKTAICQVYVGGREDVKHIDRLGVQKNTKFRKAEFCTWDQVDGVSCCLRLSELHLPLQVNPQRAHDDPIIKSLTQRADGFLLIYSVMDMDSFWATTGYYDLIIELRGHAETPLVYIANKTDYDGGQVVTSTKGRDAAFDLGTSFYETSVKCDPERIKFVFHDVIRQVRSVRNQAKLQEQSCTRMRGLICRLSLRSKRKRSQSRTRQKSSSSEQSKELSGDHSPENSTELSTDQLVFKS